MVHVSIKRDYEGGEEDVRKWLQNHGVGSGSYLAIAPRANKSFRNARHRTGRHTVAQSW